MKNKTHISIALPVLLAFTLIACENGAWNCLRGNGTIEKETRDLQQYNGVVTEGDYDIYCNVEEKLNVYISGSGNIYYKGEPSISTNISGSGKVVSIN